MILTHGEKVAVIPEDEIEAIRRTLEGSYRVEPHPFLKVGERVRVIRGSLEGVEGVLLRKKRICAGWFFPWQWWRNEQPWRLTARMWSL